MTCREKVSTILLMKYIIAIIKGMLIGLAILIPGVSGGSMIMTMGIYEQAISITSKDKSVRRKAIVFMIPYVIGIALGVLLLSGVMVWCFANYPFQTAMAFIGMILGSLPMLCRQVKGKKFSFTGAIFFVLMVAIMVILPHMTGAAKEMSVDFAGAALGVALGFIAAGTMIVPGISGSMVMLVLGYYHSLIEHVDALKNSLFSLIAGKGVQSSFGSDIFILLFFGIGVLLGLLVVSRGIKWLLNHKPVPTYYAIMGLMISSPYPIILKSEFTASILTPVNVITGIVVLVLGFGLAMFLDLQDSKK